MRRQIAHLIALAFGLTVPLPVTLLAQQGIVSLNPNDGVALTTEPNTTYLIEASEDLQTWLPWQTFTATNSLPVTFPVEFESIGKAFYRAFVVYQNDWAVGRTLVDGYPLAAMSEDGLQMMILAQARTETDFHLLGTVVWNTNHVVLTVLFGPEGVPDLARLGNTTFLFRNYQANSVGVGVLFDDGTSNIVRNVSLGRASAPDPNRSIQKSGRNQHSVSQAYWDLLSSARAKTESAVMVVRMSEMIAEDPELGASALLHRLGYWLQRNLELTYSVDAFHFDVTHGFSGDLIARRRLETWIGHGAVKDLFSALAALREHLRRLDEALASGEIVGSLHPSTAYFGSLASTGSINVKALADWSSQSTEPWVEIWSGHDGSGDGTIHYNVWENVSTVARQGSIIVSNRTHVIHQAGASPFLRISPEEAAFRTEGGPLEIEVTSNIRWIAQRNVGWLTPLNPGFQEGDAIALFTVEPNLSVGPRVGRVSIEDKILIVRQDGIPAEFAISPLEQVFSSDGGEALVDVTANTEWTATPTINWIFFPQGMTFQGDARLSYRIHNNPDPWPRTGYLYIGDQEHVIRQAGNVPSLRIYPEAAANFGSAGGAGEFTVECRDTVIWWPIADVPWISMLGEYPLQGGGFARYLVAVNPSTESRTGRILVGNTIHRVSQSGAAPLLEIAPLESNFPATGGNGVIQVVANSTWSAASLQDWILLAPESSGSGNGEVRYAVLAHTTSDTRTGTISINHIDHRVTQTGVASPPAVTQFQINNGEASTTDRAVVLRSQCSGSPGEFAASEDPFLLVDEVVWRPYTPAVEFTLSEGAGVKTVYFKVRNAVGESGVSSASIYYQPVYDGLYLGRWSIEHGGKDRSSELLLYVTIEGVLRARRMPGVYHDIPDDCAVEKPGASVVIPWFSMPGVYFERYELTVESPTKMTGLLRRPVFLFEPEEEVFPIVCTHIPPEP